MYEVNTFNRSIPKVEIDFVLFYVLKKNLLSSSATI